MAAISLVKQPSTVHTVANNRSNNLQHRITKPNPLLLPYFPSINPSFLSPLKWPPGITTTHSSTHRPISATVLSSLPTAKPERFGSSSSSSTGKVPKWSWRAIKAFTMAELEARKLKYANTGTEALLLGILVEGTSEAAKYLWANGITVFKVREEAIKLLGKADMYYFPPERPPLTEDAQRVVDWAIDHRLNPGGEVTTTDLLLGLWSEVESPGHKLLATLGFNDEKAKELASLSSGPGFVDG